MEKLGFERMFLLAPTKTIQDKLAITDRMLKTHNKIICSVSGGADSDCLMHLAWNLDTENKVDYLFIDTGIEMDATKKHLRYLEDLYGVKIHVAKPKIPCAASVIMHGYPFHTKVFAENIGRLQRHGFDFTSEYADPEKHTASGAEFWNNSFSGGKTMSEIGSAKYLKDYMISTTPTFTISKRCCDDCKKEPAHRIGKGCDLMMTGIRKAEGGVRAQRYHTCTVIAKGRENYDTHMPLFWWKDSDKKAYEDTFGVVHSAAYTVYGFKRTGCADNTPEDVDALLTHLEHGLKTLK